MLLLLSSTSASVPVARTVLSALTIAEDASVNDVIGTLSVANGSGSYTFSITADPDSKFKIANDDELQVDDTLDYETATSHLVTIEADNGVDDPISRTFTISVTNVIEAPVNVTPPAVTGSLEVGSTLVCTPGVYTDMGPGSGASFAYQWKDASDDSDIAGADEITLPVTHALLGLNVYCVETPTNSAGSGTPVNSNTVGPVVDTTAPTLSAADSSGTGYTTGEAEVSTNEGNGTLYMVVTTSATPPSQAQVKAGQNHAGAAATFADDAAVSASGAQAPISITGLTHTTTYHVYWMHEDAEGNQSAVLADSFATTAAAVPGAFVLADWDIVAGDEEADVTINDLPTENGASITDIEYRLDGGSWVSSGGTTSFTITGLTNDQEYDVELRAVNSVGNGAASDTKLVTPEDDTPATFQEQVIALLGAKLRAFWLEDDPTTLWQNTDGTGAVSSDTDPVGRITDLSGNGKHRIQGTSGNRPAYRTGASRVRYDGVNDHMTVASAAFAIDEFHLFTVMSQHAAGPNDAGIYTFAPSSGHDYASASAVLTATGNASQYLSLYGNAGATEMSVIYNGSGNLPLGLYEFRKSTTRGDIYVNSSLQASDTSFTAFNTTHSGAFVDNARYYTSAVQTSTCPPLDKFCTIITAALTTGEIDDLNALINARYSLW